MGISGHILGDRKLRQLNAHFPGYTFNRAYNRNGQGEARMFVNGECIHFWVNFHTWEIERVHPPRHWSSCPRVPVP